MKKMLIDATSQSEIRLAVVNEKKLENYEFEPRPTKYTKGNIYLAKVVRVEPSLQAAFVEYADNTQGFLPFSEIHPDYFRIPVEDYEALMAEQREQRRQSSEAEDTIDEDSDTEVSADESVSADSDADKAIENTEGTESTEDSAEKVQKNRISEDAADLDEDGERPLVFTPKIAKQYSIQEVIKRGQLMLVQVAKEERGKKRAALSTYIALAGCYCVLIPNALFNGGVSRKIESTKERKRLKKVLSSIDIPDAMALILRTAAEGKTKASINRELKYLQSFWEELRKRTMDSVAPLLIHEEGDLINRSLRDIFSKQIEEVHIAGSDAYKQAKDFTKLLNPKLSRSIKEFVSTGSETLFESFGLEIELQNLVQPEVVMPSGGALVIEQTEALVSIDVNSGRAIGERNIEETALKINLEAAEEIARQLRLRNLAGLVVCDFIDMDRRGNQQKVEKTLKAALKNDKARIHVGRISSFGLLEMSRQRMGPSIQEKLTDICPHCQGHGHVLHQDGMVSALLRSLHQRMSDAADSPLDKITVYCIPKVAQVLLNEHLQALHVLEEQYGVKVVFEIDPTLQSIHGWSLDKVGRAVPRDRNNKRRDRNSGRDRNKSRDDSRRNENTAADATEGDAEQSNEDKPKEEGGRKRRRRSGRGRKSNNAEGVHNEAKTEGQSADNTQADVQAEDGQEKTSRPKRRHQNKKRKPEVATEEIQSGSVSDTASDAAPAVVKESRRPKKESQEESAKPQKEATKPQEESTPVRGKPQDVSAPVRGKPQPSTTEDIKPKRKGWWNIL